MSAIERAVEALEKASGGRPFVLVYERRAKTASSTALTTHVPRGQTTYETLGLLHEGRMAVEDWIRGGFRADNDPSG